MSPALRIVIPRSPRGILSRAAFAFLFSAIAVLLLIAQSHSNADAASSLTWDGGGGDNNWSTCANWSADQCPIAGDTVTFNATSTKDSTIDAGADASVATININSGYTGTITLGRTWSATTSFVQAAGSFTASNQSLSVAIFTLSGGTFTASSGTTTASGVITVSGSPTFNHNSGTFAITGSGAVTCNSVVFNSVTITNSGTRTINNGCDLPLGASPTIAATVALSGTLSGTGTLTSSAGTLTLNSGSALSGFSGYSGVNLTIATGAALDASSFSTLTLTGTLTMSGTGSLTAPSGTMSVFNVSISGTGTFTHNSGTLNLTGSSATLACNNQVFNLVTFNNSGAKTVGSTCSLPLGANPTIATSVILNGTLSGTGTLTSSAGTLTLNSGSSLSGFSGYSGVNLTIATGASLDAGSYSPFTLTGTLTMSGTGSLTAPTGTMNMFNVSISGTGTFTHNSGTLNLTGSSATLACNNQVFNLVTFNNSNTKTVGNDCSLPLGSNPTVAQSLTLNGTLSGSGTLTFSAGTFTLNNGYTISGFSGINTVAFANNATFDASSYSVFSLTSTFSLGASSVFTAPSGILALPSTVTISSGAVFNSNSGTINITGTTATISCGGVAFNIVTFNNSSTKTVSADCSLPLGSNPTITTSVTLNGTLSGSGTLAASAGTLTLNSGSAVSGFTGLNLYSFTNNGTFDAGALSPFTVANSFILGASSTFVAPSDTLTVASAFTVNSGAAFNANGGTMEFSGATSTIACGNINFNLVTFNNVSTKTVNSDCSLPLGNDPTIPLSLTLNGTLSGTGTITLATGTLTLNSGSSLSGFSALVTDKLTVNGTFNAGAYSPFHVSGAFTLGASSSFTSPSGTLTLDSTVTITAGATFNANGGTVDLGSEKTATISCGNVTFNRVTLTNSATKTISNDCSLPLGADPNAGTSGGFALSGTLSGTGTLTTGFLQLNTGSYLTGFSDLVTDGLEINDTSADLSGLTSVTSEVNDESEKIQTWTATTSLNSASSNHTSVLYNGYIYAVGGEDNSSYLDTVSYAPVNADGTLGTWQSTTSLPSGRGGMTSIATNGYLYVMGGNDSGGTRVNETLYAHINSDGSLGVWNTGPSFSGPRSRPRAETNNGFIYIIGGQGDPDALNDVQFAAINSDGSLGSWAATTSFANGRSGHATAIYEGRLYVIGGIGNSLRIDDVQFASINSDGTLGSWTATTSLTFARNSITSAIVNGNLYVIGGIADSGKLDVVEYAPINSDGTVGSWTTTTSFANGRYRHTSAVFGNHVYVIGGWAGGSSYYSDVQMSAFDSGFVLKSGKSFTAPPSLSIKGSFEIESGATFNANGGTIAFDGSIDQSPTCGSAVFSRVVINKSNGDLTVGASCTFPLGNNATTTLDSDNKLIVVGSLQGSGSLTTNATLQLNVGNTLSGFSTLVTNDLTVNGDSSLDSFSAVDVNGDFTVQNSAEFEATSATMAVAGDFTVTSGSNFDANGGSVVLDGADQSVLGTTFHNLAKTVSTSATLTFPAGGTETVTGSLLLTGSAGQLLSIVSEDPGTQWRLVANGSVAISYVSLVDSHNLSTQVLSALNSHDGGNNTRWDFGSPDGETTTTTSKPPYTTSNATTTESAPVADDSTGEAAENSPQETGAAKAGTEGQATERVTGPHNESGNSFKWFIIGAPIATILMIFFILRRRNNKDDKPKYF